MAIYQATGIAHCYTIECNYHNGKKINHIPSKMNLITKKGEPETAVTDITSKIYSTGTSPPFTTEILEDAGRAAGAAFLDIIGDNPISRIAGSKFKNVPNVRQDIRNMLSNKILVRKGKRKDQGASAVQRTHTMLNDRFGGAKRKQSATRKVELTKQNSHNPIASRKHSNLHFSSQIHSAGYERPAKNRKREKSVAANMKPIIEERKEQKKPYAHASR